MRWASMCWICWLSNRRLVRDRRRASDYNQVTVRYPRARVDALPQTAPRRAALALLAYFDLATVVLHRPYIREILPGPWLAML